MIQRPPLRKAYLFIKKNRFRKKMEVYKLALAVMVDITTAIYLLIIVGYLFASIFILGDFINDYDDQFIRIEQFLSGRYWLIATILPLRYITQSFSNPGIVFSSAEHQLSMLPYDKRKIWLLTALEKWIKKLIVYTLIGLLLVVITPISTSLVIAYIGLSIVIDIMMTVPQWKLYQTRFITKVGWVCLMFIINAIGFLMNSPITGITLFGLFIIVNMRLTRTLFNDVKWDNVIEASDFKIWNMPLISQASETKFKRQKKPVSENSSKRKPFTYTEKVIQQRIFGVYLRNNADLVVQIMGSLFVLLFVFLFINNFLFYIVLAIAIHIYTTVLASFFKDRFQADILHVLPWDLQGYKKTYFKWVIYGGIILLIPVGIYLGMNATIWLPFQFLFYGSVCLFLYHVKVDKAIALLGNRSISFQVEEGLGIFLLIGIGFSGLYPVITFSSFITIWYLKKRSKIGRT